MKTKIMTHDMLDVQLKGEGWDLGGSDREMHSVNLEQDSGPVCGVLSCTHLETALANWAKKKTICFGMFALPQPSYFHKV